MVQMTAASKPQCLRSVQHTLDDMTSGLASGTQSFGEAVLKIPGLAVQLQSEKKKKTKCLNGWLSNLP